MRVVLPGDAPTRATVGLSGSTERSYDVHCRARRSTRPSDYPIITKSQHVSIHVFYQPLDVGVIQDAVFPFIRGDGDLNTLLERCDDSSSAIAVLQPLRNAYAAHLAGSDYVDPEWGRCDPTEFFVDRCVPAVLEFSRHIWPYRLVDAFTSIDLLPDGFPVIEHYQMPVTLFQPIVVDIPDIALELETIADSERMGGVVPADHVNFVLKTITDDLDRSTRDPSDPFSYDATLELKAALTYAAANGLSFTEAIE